MITVSEAQAIVQKNLPPRRVETAALADAAGKILAADIAALEPSPRYTNSAMDGFAVRWEDIRQAGAAQPVSLTITGESQAGIPFRGTLQPGQAARISTGAMLCAGADAVVPVEDAEVDGAVLRVLKAEKRHQHIRFAGEEFAAGAALLKAGTLLRAAQVALLASQGIAAVPLYRPPGVSIMVTGSELVPYDAAPQPWQIRDSNGIMLRCAVESSGGVVRTSGQVGDDYPRTVDAVRQALADSQIIIFSGGVSVGAHDLVKAAAGECGFETLFWRVRQRPGKPLFFARRGEVLFFGLPGNPVSALMCYLYYIHPVIRQLCGAAFAHHAVAGRLAQPIRNPLSRAQLFRVSLTPAGPSLPEVRPLAKQASHMLTSVSDAGGFILLEVGADLAEGEIVPVYPFI